ncbi:hypothetical protein C8R46DRAFT_1032748 [Mycena filopes]|nr:hypothetical protein C8R46DRAFT_1032748 [Mycena filopes]
MPFFENATNFKISGGTVNTFSGDRLVSGGEDMIPPDFTWKFRPNSPAHRSDEQEQSLTLTRSISRGSRAPPTHQKLPRPGRPRAAGEGGNIRASQRAYPPGQSASSGPNPHASRPPSAPTGSWDEDSQYFPPSRDRGSANSPAHHPDATAYNFPTSPMQYHNPAVNTGGPSKPRRGKQRQPSGTNKPRQKPEPVSHGGSGGSSAPVPPNSSDPEPENGEGNGYNSDWEHDFEENRRGTFEHRPNESDHPWEWNQVGGRHDVYVNNVYQHQEQYKEEEEQQAGDYMRDY